MSRSRRDGRERRKDGPSTGRARAPLGPGARARSCPCACRCGRWPARAARRPGTGSSPGQRPQRRRDHRRVGGPRGPDTVGARQLDLDQAGGRLRRIAGERRHGRDRHGREARHARRRRREPGLGPQPLAPGEELAGADPAPPRHPVHRLARRERLGHQPPLVILRPAPPRPPLEDLDPAHPLAPATGLTTPRQTRRSGDPPRSRQPRKAALPGGILSINTVTKLLVDAGTACSAFHDERVRASSPRRIQVDEVWSFCYAKAKNVPTAKAAPAEAGDVWTWTALDADTKLMCSWLVGPRDGEYAEALLDDLRS